MSNTGNPELLRQIVARIEETGPISFARFMEMALYEPGTGYYVAGPGRLGKKGDFFTASDVGFFFGECIARQLCAMDRFLGAPRPFQVVEFGGGRGLLAEDILRTLELRHLEVFERTRYAMVDRSAGMRAAASDLGTGLQVVAPEKLAEISGVAGCVLAVELFDALPVHRLVRRESGLKEIRVGIGPGGLEEVETSPGPALQHYAERYGAASSVGHEAEVCLEMPARFDQLSQVLDCGFMILVDYGYSAREKYGPARSRGTLMAYQGHTTSEDYLQRVGEQDLTAHVNWTALADHAASRGWRQLAMTTQDRFLIANGILEGLEARNESELRDPDMVRRRMLAKQLIHPEGMGRMFQVMVLYKGEGEPPQLEGLVDPFRAPPPGL